MSPIEAAARSDAEFDGRTFEAMGRADRDRYLARSAKAITAFIEAAAEDATICKVVGEHADNAVADIRFSRFDVGNIAILALKEAVNAG